MNSMLWDREFYLWRFYDIAIYLRLALFYWAKTFYLWLAGLQYKWLESIQK